MRILFVSTHTNPLNPPINGDAQRTCLLFEACKRVAEVDVLSFEGQPDQAPPLGRWKKWMALLPFSKTTALFPVDPHKEAVVDEAVKKGNYDFIVARYFYRAIPCGLWKYREKLIVDFDDSLSFFFVNQLAPNAALTTRVRLKLSAKKARSIMRRAVRKMHAAFFADETTAKDSQGVFLPNIPFYKEGCHDADMSVPLKRIVFVGQLEYQPNKEGLSHFLDQVYKPLRERLPNVEMRVVGLIKDDALRQRWESCQGVTVTGFVDDLKREYEQSHVVVVPVYRCGATNIKLLEAMAMNRACVTTQEAFAKLGGPFEKERDLCVAANDNEFVEKLVALLTNVQLNNNVAHQGKTVMDRYYSFDVFAEIVENSIKRQVH